MEGDVRSFREGKFEETEIITDRKTIHYTILICTGVLISS